MSISSEEILRTALRDAGATDDHLPSLLSQLSLPTSALSALSSVAASTSTPSIVRFRSFLQDTSYAPEIFLPASMSSSPADDARRLSEGELDYGLLKERNVAFSIGLPGEQAWVGQALQEQGEDVRSKPLPKHLAHKFPYLQSGRKEPFSPAENASAFIKCYDLAYNLSPGTVHTFIGLLTSEPAPSVDDEDFPRPPDQGNEGQDEDVATLHVLRIESGTPDLGLPDLETEGVWESAWKELVRFVCDEGLGGEDEWVGELILAGLCTNSASPLQPLSISLLPPSSTSASSPPLPLLSLLPLLLPLCTTVPVSISLLSSQLFSPALSPTSPSLSAGALQIPPSSLLHIDESPLGQGGSLPGQALSNLQSLQALIKTQKLAYQFPFSAFEFSTDVNILITGGDSKGGTLLPADVVIPLTRPPSAYTTSPTLPSADQLARFRALLASARSRSLSVPSSVSAAIQESFVAHRATHGAASLTGEQLGVRMRIARGISMGMGREEMQLDVWERVVLGDEKRAGRQGGEGLVKERPPSAEEKKKAESGKLVGR